MMTCPRCKKPLPKGAMRCPQCARGRAIPRSKQSAQKPVILVVVVLAVVGIAAYFVFATSNSAQPEQSARKPNTPTKRDPLAGLPEKVRNPRAQLGEDRETYVTLQPGQTSGAPLKADRPLVAVFDVTPTNGSILAAAMIVKSVGTITPSEDSALGRLMRQVEKGTASIVTCEAEAGDLVGCFVRNAGDKPTTVRVRVRWWGLAEPPSAPPAPSAPDLPPTGDDRTQIKTLLPGQKIEMLITTDKPSQGIIDITPEAGTVSAALIKLKDIQGEDISDADKKETMSQLQDISVPGTWSKAYSCKPGDAHYCVIINRGNQPTTYKLRHRTGSEAK